MYICMRKNVFPCICSMYYNIFYAFLTLYCKRKQPYGHVLFVCPSVWFSAGRIVLPSNSDHMNYSCCHLSASRRSLSDGGINRLIFLMVTFCFRDWFFWLPWRQVFCNVCQPSRAAEEKRSVPKVLLKCDLCNGDVLLSLRQGQVTMTTSVKSLFCWMSL
jgi:hypothetical protein